MAPGLHLVAAAAAAAYVWSVKRSISMVGCFVRWLTVSGSPPHHLYGLGHCNLAQLCALPAASILPWLCADPATEDMACLLPVSNDVPICIVLFPDNLV